MAKRKMIGTLFFALIAEMDLLRRSTTFLKPSASASASS